MQSYNGISILNKAELSSNCQIFLDASLEGIGAVWGERCYGAPIPYFPSVNMHITHLEMINMVVTLRTWGHLWKGLIVKFRCDNLAVVHVSNSGRTRDPFLATCARNMWWLCAHFDIELKVEHVEGIKNVEADALSRIYSSNPSDVKVLEILGSQKLFIT